MTNGEIQTINVVHRGEFVSLMCSHMGEVDSAFVFPVLKHLAWGNWKLQPEKRL
jgi:hypothetical protein